MIKRISLILCIFLFNSCEKQDENINPFIPDVSFEKTINLSLPNYDNLNYNGGSYFLQNVGVKGVILFNLNNSIDIYPGSLIYVTRDIDKVAGLEFTAASASIFSSLALALASLNSIN